MDLILRNARVSSKSGEIKTDIGVNNGRIVVIQPNLEADGQELDLGDRMVSPGFVETHIHLDKSCILDRCKSVKGDLDEAIEQTSTSETGLYSGRRLCARCAHSGESDSQWNDAHAYTS